MLRLLNASLLLTAASCTGVISSAASVEERGPTVSSGPSTLWANVRQLQHITVLGSFKPGTNISCRVVDAPYDGTNFCPYCQSPAEIPRPGRVINSTAASCVVAGSASGILDPTKDAGHGGSPGFAAGSGQLMFSTDNRSWPHKGWPLDFVPLCDSAIGRRPYFSNETEAELIVSLGPPLAPSTAVYICASALGRALFPCTNVYPTVDGRSTVIPFNLTTLPETFNTTISVNFSCDALGLSGSLERWFVRVPHAARAAGSVVVVDHRHRSLRVDGELWVGRGFYWPNTQALSLEDERAWMFYLAQQGINQLELGLNERSFENTTRILAMAESFGIKVMFSVVSTVDHIMNCTGRSVCNSEDKIRTAMDKLWRFVDAHKTSSALLSWYICDDCPCGGDAASDAKRHALSFVYSLLKQRDPYHITTGAGGCGNMYALGEPYALSLDMIMYENYDPEPRDHFGGGSWPTGKGIDGGFRHYPIAFEPLCNLQGFYTVYASHTSRPPFSRPQQDQESLAWASTLAAAIPNQLAFALEPPKYAGPQGIAAFGRFARSIEALKHLVLQDLAGPILTVKVNSSTGPMLGKAFVQQESVDLPAINRSWCAILVVINGQNQPARFQAELRGLQSSAQPHTPRKGSYETRNAITAVPEYVHTAFTMLPFNSYSISLSNGTNTEAREVRKFEDMVSECNASTPPTEIIRQVALLEILFFDAATMQRVPQLPANGIGLYRLSAQQLNNQLGCPKLR